MSRQTKKDITVDTDEISVGSTYEIEQRRGLWYDPEELKGKVDHGLRKFLVFYFDSEDDYNFVLSVLRDKTSRVRSHPALLTDKLLEALKHYENKGGNKSKDKKTGNKKRV